MKEGQADSTGAREGGGGGGGEDGGGEVLVVCQWGCFDVLCLNLWMTSKLETMREWVVCVCGGDEWL